MKDLNKRANILVKKIKAKDVIIYEDHRYLVNVLYFCIKNKIIKKIPNLIYFDQHDDCIEIDKNIINTTKKYRAKLPDIKEFWNFTEFDLSEKDDDWLFVLLELGFVKDVIQVGSNDYNGDNFRINDGLYKDHLKKEHKIISINHLWKLFEYKNNKIINPIKSNGYKDIINFFELEEDFILDIDLDCFSYDCVGERRAIPKDRFNELFNQNGAKELFQRLFKKAKLITIAKESDYCGGTKESEKILNMIFDLIRD